MVKRGPGRISGRDSTSREGTLEGPEGSGNPIVRTGDNGVM